MRDLLSAEPAYSAQGRRSPPQSSRSQSQLSEASLGHHFSFSSIRRAQGLASAPRRGRGMSRMMVSRPGRSPPARKPISADRPIEKPSYRQPSLTSVRATRRHPDNVRNADALLFGHNYGSQLPPGAGRQSSLFERIATEGQRVRREARKEVSRRLVVRSLDR